jgi:glycosyltransferase involved in cell wall biosynthesis
MLVRVGAADPAQVVIVPGSGVDLSEFQSNSEVEGSPVAIMVSRLLYEKGIAEFVEAARLTAGHESGLRWVLAGGPDPGNPGSVDEATFSEWREEGVVDCLGERRDIASLYASAHIAVLPSYREGLPKSLIEAAASGRAVVTTDVPGCRDAVAANESGVLVPPRDARALADAVLMLATDCSLRRQMGQAGRRLAAERFDVRVVQRRHVDLYRELSAWGTRSAGS